MAPEWLAFYDGILALVLASVGVVGAHFGLMSPMFGFSLMFVWAFMLAVIGSIVGMYARYRYSDPKAVAMRNRATVGVVMSAAVAIPVAIMALKGMTAGYPAINDITTDVKSPPEFVHAQLLAGNQDRDMKYDQARYAASQRAGYGIVAPLKEKMDPAEAFKRVQEVASQVPVWKVTYIDPATMTLEGVAVSKIFRFPDDFIIQVRPAPGGGSLIEMRSKSRYGVGDFGVNHRRISHFFDRMALARGAPQTEDIP